MVYQRSLGRIDELFFKKRREASQLSCPHVLVSTRPLEQMLEKGKGDWLGRKPRKNAERTC